MSIDQSNRSSPRATPSTSQETHTTENFRFFTGPQETTTTALLLPLLPPPPFGGRWLQSPRVMKSPQHRNCETNNREAGKGEGVIRLALTDEKLSILSRIVHPYFNYHTNMCISGQKITGAASKLFYSVHSSFSQDSHACASGRLTPAPPLRLQRLFKKKKKTHDKPIISI